jgi:hypothetical protein
MRDTSLILRQEPASDNNTASEENCKEGNPPKRSPSPPIQSQLLQQAQQPLAIQIQPSQLSQKLSAGTLSKRQQQQQQQQQLFIKENIVTQNSNAENEVKKKPSNANNLTTRKENVAMQKKLIGVSNTKMAIAKPKLQEITNICKN